MERPIKPRKTTAVTNELRLNCSSISITDLEVMIGVGQGKGVNRDSIKMSIDNTDYPPKLVVTYDKVVHNADYVYELGKYCKLAKEYRDYMQKILLEIDDDIREHFRLVSK